MIFPSNRVRIMVATKPIDFRKGHDGLAALVKNELHKDPFTGTVFVFRSRRVRISRRMGADFARCWAAISRDRGQAGRRFHGVRLERFGQAFS